MNTFLPQNTPPSPSAEPNKSTKRRQIFWSLLFIVILIVGGGWYTVKHGMLKFVSDKIVKEGAKEVAPIDISTWPTFKNEKLGVSMKVPPGYLKISLGQRDSIALLSNIPQEKVDEYTKINNKLEKELAPREPATYPFLSATKIENTTIEQAYKKEYGDLHFASSSQVAFRRTDIFIHDRQVILIEDGETWSRPQYLALFQLKDDVLKVVWSPEQTESQFNVFEVMIRTLSVN